MVCIFFEKSLSKCTFTDLLRESLKFLFGVWTLLSSCSPVTTCLLPSTWVTSPSPPFLSFTVDFNTHMHSHGLRDPWPLRDLLSQPLPRSSTSEILMSHIPPFWLHLSASPSASFLKLSAQGSHHFPTLQHLLSIVYALNSLDSMFWCHNHDLAIIFYSRAYFCFHQKFKIKLQAFLTLVVKQLKDAGERSHHRFI